MLFLATAGSAADGCCHSVLLEPRNPAIGFVSFIFLFFFFSLAFYEICPLLPGSLPRGEVFWKRYPEAGVLGGRGAAFRGAGQEPSAAASVGLTGPGSGRPPPLGTSRSQAFGRGRGGCWTEE